MKKKSKSDNDIAAIMTQIQGQLAVLDQKLDSFMTKSLTELAQALAASKPAARLPVFTPAPARAPQNEHPPRRPMYAVVCFECGKDTEIPFKPSGNRPVYCKECFAKRKGQPAPVSSAVSFTAAPSAVSGQEPVVVPAPMTRSTMKAPTGKPVKAKKKAAKKPAVKVKSALKKKPAKK
jgi:CxxC-x17-CxxC domain-containing protein